MAAAASGHARGMRAEFGASSSANRTAGLCGQTPLQSLTLGSRRVHLVAGPESPSAYYASSNGDRATRHCEERPNSIESLRRVF